MKYSNFLNLINTINKIIADADINSNDEVEIILNIGDDFIDIEDIEVRYNVTLEMTMETNIIIKGEKE